MMAAAPGNGTEKEIAVDFSNPFTASDLSLSFWWRNSAYPNEGRTVIRLLGVPGGVGDIFGIAANYYRPSSYFNGVSGVLSEGINKASPMMTLGTIWPWFMIRIAIN